MHILFTRFPLESAYGGAEVQTLSLMQGLRERGHDVAFLGSCPVLLEKAAICDLQAARLDIGKPPVTQWNAISFFWRRASMRKRIIRALESRAAPLDAIVMLSLSEKLLITKWAAARKIRVFWVEHDRIGRWLTKNPWLPSLRRLVPFAATVCVSDLSKQMLLNLGWLPQNTTAIPNGVAGWTVPARTGPRQGPLRLLCVARLTRDKGVDVLVDALPRVPDASLVIVGQGRDGVFLRETINKSPAQERITLLPKGDVRSLCAESDVLVLPSREHDPFGMIAAEAMMAGIPVVVTTMCGIAGYLQNGTDALIVPANDSMALAQALQTLSAPDVRANMGRAAQKRATVSFALPKMIDAYEALLRGTAWS